MGGVPLLAFQSHVFYCYKQWETLVVHNRQGSMCCIPDREGVIQGNPLSMIIYDLGILSLICCIKLLISVPRQPWYANDSAIMATWALIVDYFNALTIYGP